MATVGDINIGMTTNLKPLEKGLKEASTKLNGFTDKVTSTSTLVKGLFAGAVFGGATMAITNMARQAATLEESMNKIDAVFGEAASGVSQQAETMAQAFGISINQMTDAAGRMGSMFRGAGFDESASAEYTNVLTRLANDLSRFNDTSFETAFQKLRSGLSGESEPLRDFGVFLTEANVKAKALEMGLGGLGGELSDMAKIQARAAIIMEQAGPAIGAAGREADGASAKMEALSGRWENLTTTIGEQFAPMIGDVMGGLGTTIQVLGDAWSRLSATIAEWGGSTLESLGLAGQGVNVLEVAVGGLANAWQMLKIGWQTLQTTMTASLAGAALAVADLMTMFDSATEALTGWSTGIGKTMKTMADSMRRSADQAVQGVKDEWSKPWASSSVSDYFQSFRDENEKLRQELASKPMTLPVVMTPVAEQLAGGLGEQEAKAWEDKLKQAKMQSLREGRTDPFAGTMLRGSKEATETVLRVRYGGNKDEVADNTRKTAAGVEQLVRVLSDVKYGLTQKADGSLGLAKI